MPLLNHPHTSIAEVDASLRLQLLNFSLRHVVKRRLQAMSSDAETIIELRAHVESLVERLMPDKAKNVEFVADTIGQVPVERIVPEAPNGRTILYIHGGAFIVCSPQTHRGITAPLARYSQCEVVAVDYRLAPEHPYPAAVNDVLFAYRGLLDSSDAQNITIAGDSAGGNLVLALLLAARAEGLAMPASAVCLSPCTDLTGSSESIRTNIAQDPLLPGERMYDMAKVYLGDAYIREPTASPVFGDFRGMPPLLFHVGESEILIDDSRRVVNRAREAGVEAHLRIWPRVPHVFHAFSSHLPVAHVALQEIADFMLAQFRRPK